MAAPYIHLAHNLKIHLGHDDQYVHQDHNVSCLSRMQISSPDENPRFGYFWFDGCSGTQTKYHERTTQQSRVVKKHDPT